MLWQGAAICYCVLCWQPAFCHACYTRLPVLQPAFNLQLTPANVSAAATLTARYNDLDSVRAVFKENKDQIAGIMLEPVVGNSGYIAPTQEFLQVSCPGRAACGPCELNVAAVLFTACKDQGVCNITSPAAEAAFMSVWPA